MIYSSKQSLFGLSGLITFVMILSSCGSGPSEFTPVTNEFQSYSIDIDKSKVHFSYVFESVELMQLEETSESLLTVRDHVIRSGDKWIFSGYDDGRVFTFSEQGKYISQFNNMGAAEGQYSGVKDMWVEDNTIGIYDGRKQIVHWYDLTGQHIKSIEVSENTHHILPFEKGYAMDMSFTPLTDSINYKVLLVDEQFELKKQQVPFRSQIAFKMGGNNNSFSYWNEQLVFNAIYADTTYLINSDGAEPFFQIDFGEKYLWKDEALKKSTVGAMMAIPEGEGVWNYVAYVGDDFIYLKYSLSLDEFAVVIDRKNGAYQLPDIFIEGNERYDLLPIAWEGDRLLFSIPSSSVASLLGEMKNEQYEFVEGTSLDKIESSENSVLLWARFKDIAK